MAKAAKVKATEPKSGIVDRKHYQYQRSKSVTKDGTSVRTLNNGDAVARALTGMSRPAINRVLQDLGEMKWVRSSGKLNVGQHRMIAGNKIRAKVRKGVSVSIGGFVVKSLEQKDPTTEQAAEANHAPAKKRK